LLPTIRQAARKVEEISLALRVFMDH